MRVELVWWNDEDAASPGAGAAAGATARKKSITERVAYLPPPGDAFDFAKAELRAAACE